MDQHQRALLILHERIRKMGCRVRYGDKIVIWTPDLISGYVKLGEFQHDNLSEIKKALDVYQMEIVKKWSVAISGLGWTVAKLNNDRMAILDAKNQVITDAGYDPASQAELNELVNSWFHVELRLLGRDASVSANTPDQGWTCCGEIHYGIVVTEEQVRLAQQIGMTQDQFLAFLKEKVMEQNPDLEPSDEHPATTETPPTNGTTQSEQTTG